MMKRHNGMERLPPGMGSPPSHIGEGAGLGTGNIAGASGSVLYVDVVKNMPKPKAALLSRTKAPSAPEFSIFHEDFPALPGIGTGASLRMTTHSSQESSAVPDNWTDIISSDEDPHIDNGKAIKHAEINNNLDHADDNGNDQDDDDDDDDEEDDEDDDDDDVEEMASDTPASASTASPLSTDDNISMTSQRSSSSSNLSLKQVSSQLKSNVTDNVEQEQNIALAMLSHLHLKTLAEPLPPPPPPPPPPAPPAPPPSTEAMPQMYEYWPQEGRRFAVSQIFDKQFITVGVRQRAINGMVKRPRKLDTSTPIPTPTMMPAGITTPGYETSKIYARLRTNDQGMPLGGVKLDKIPPHNSNFTYCSSSTTDNFGLLGLAANLGCASHSPQMFGDDPHCLNIDMHCCASSASSFNLHSAFAGPLLGGRCLPHDVTYDVPKVYRISDRLGLQQPKIHQMQVELLFFFFYNYPGDMMQMLAAAELAERSWRYHKYERLWLKRQPDNPNYLYRGQLEAGEYNYFNMVQWKILPRHFNLEPDHVERTITKTELLEQYGYHPQMSFN